MNKGDRPPVQWLEVATDQAGQRLDNFLLRLLKGVPRSRIYRILRKGEVRVNRGRVRPDYRLQAGDQLRIPPIRVSQTEARPVSSGMRARLAGKVLYEDDRLLIIDKPAGMAVHGGSGVSAGVIEALRAERPEAPYLELVHRLDRDTSGCLMIAKKRSELRMLHTLLREGAVTKRYLLLARGDWSKGPWEADAPLRKNQLSGGERIVRVDAAGKPARTRFSLLQRLPSASLMEAQLDTGRTHQIRVHAAHLGHPLGGDEKYGDPAFNRYLRAAGLRRLFLHAHHVAFRDPERGREVEVSAPLADDLRELINRLESQAGSPPVKEYRDG